jgi:lysophospholipase L1-like esterase
MANLFAGLTGLPRDPATGALQVSGAGSIAGQISRMVVFGDSITSGYGPAKLSQGWAFGVSKALGCDVIMYARGGAAWAQEDVAQNVTGVSANGPFGAGRPGGWASILNAVRALVPAPGATAGVPLGDFITFAYGLNDLWTDNATVSEHDHASSAGVPHGRVPGASWHVRSYD